MRVATSSPSLAVDPGTTTEVVVDIVNDGEVIDGVSTRVRGLPAHTVQAQPALLPLFPDSTGTVTLSLTVPSSLPAGSHPLTIEVVSEGTGLAPQLVGLELCVAPRPAMALTAAPSEVRARRTGRFVLAVANEGNVALEVALRGTEADRASTVRFTPDRVSVPAGGVAQVELKVRGPRMFTGGEVDRSVTVEAAAVTTDAPVEGGAGPVEILTPKATTVQLRQRPLLSRGLITALTLALIVGLWAGVFLLVLTEVFSGDPVTKAAPASFFAASTSADAQAAEAGGSGAAASPGTNSAAATPAGALPKTGQMPAGAGGTVSGTVVSESEDKPVGRILVEAIRKTPHGLEQASSAASQGDGSYRLPGLFPGEYFLKFSADGFDTVWYPAAPAIAGAKPVAATARGVSSGVDVVITGQPATISGAVDTGDVGPPAATKVVAIPLQSTTTTGPVATDTTNGAGEYTLTDLPAPATYQLTFTAPGYATSTIVDTVNAGGDRLEPTVRLGASTGQLSGMVTDGNQPLGGATVSTTVNGEPVSVLTPTAGAVGSFALGDLPTPATYVVTFSAPGHGSRTEIVDLGAGESRLDLDATLRRGSGSVSGRLVDADGEGLGGATVTIGGTSGGDPPSTTTLTTGRVGSFVINGLRTPGSYTVTFERDGYVASSVPITLSRQRPTPEVRVTLSTRLGSVSGAVTGPDGEAFIGADVTITDGLETWSTTSSAPGQLLRSGGYLLSGLQPGSYSVTVSAPGLRQQTALVRVKAGATTRQPLRLGE